MSQLQKKGFSAVIVLVGLVLIGAVASIGWFVVSSNEDEATNDPTTSVVDESAKNTDTPIETNQDLDAALEQVDQVPLDDDLNTTELDSDIQNVL